MTRLLTGAFAAGVLGAVAIVGAQNAYDPSKSDSVTGCLRPAADKPGAFVVADATAKRGADAKSASQAVGTSGTAKKTYAVRGVIPPGVNLSSHVSHKVELLGAITESTEKDTKTEVINMHTFKMVGTACP